MLHELSAAALDRMAAADEIAAPCPRAGVEPADLSDLD
jgi:hypothetical protein